MTNEILKAIESRRSCKKYDGKQISETELDAVLRAGLFAANGMGKQSPVFVAVTKKSLRDELSAMNAKVLGSSSDPFYGAPAVIVVFAPSDYFTGVEDGSLSIGNMLLAADSLGLGACWIHRAREMFETARGKALLREWGLPENMRGIGCCVLGYAFDDEKRAAAPRRENRIIKI